MGGRLILSIAMLKPMFRERSGSVLDLRLRGLGLYSKTCENGH